MSDVIFPYTQSYKKIPSFFKSIQDAAVPQKLTQKVLEDIFGLRGTNDRTLITILKNLGFIDGSGIPTQKYSDYKNPLDAKNVLGTSIRSCYHVLYEKNENFHTLSNDAIKGLFTSTTGKDSSNKALTEMIKTFLELKNIAKFDSTVQPTKELSLPQNDSPLNPEPKSKDFVLSHTIVLNLPTSTDQKVYDTLFKSIKENLL